MNATQDPLFDVTDKVVVITGAEGGIGSALAGGFAARGAKVVGADLGSGETMPEGTWFQTTDIAERDQVARLADFVAKELGQVDVLINNAGIERFGAAEHYSPEDWNKVIQVNLTGTFACCQAFGRTMIQRKRGKIINVASACGLFGYPFVIAYNATKAGIWSMTQTLATEWGGSRSRPSSG
jgi:NAD(P)-dependent dehydrogenase (short-subunit alcohol dehydrogenase family)